MSCHISAKTSEARVEPREDTPLEGFYHDTAWSHRTRIDGSRDFLAGAMSVLDKWLQPHEPLIQGVIETGGSVVLVLDLPGQFKFRDKMGTETLLRLGALGIGLSVEVFPNMHTY